jgi:hypothetical protein
MREGDERARVELVAVGYDLASISTGHWQITAPSTVELREAATRGT